MNDICIGVSEMHKLGISHRDLKVENILLKNSKFKIADFGSAEFSKNFLIWTEIEKMSND